MIMIIACVLILAFVGVLYYFDYRTRKQMDKHTNKALPS